MALNFDAIGKPIGPLTTEYTWKDAALYALAVGAGYGELAYCYEKRLKVLPTFSMAAIFDLFWQAGAVSGADPLGILHGEQELTFHRPIPCDGTFSTTGRIVGIFDKGKATGALVVTESDTVDGDGRPLFSSRFTIFSRHDGGFGGENAPKRPVPIPEREPDRSVDDRPGDHQPLLYRLTGDLFPLHADPDFARAAGFTRPIMHGMGTLGYACRALLHELAPHAPERARRLACRFARPLYPGTPIRTLIWETGNGRAAWQTVVPETGETILDNGRFDYGPPHAAVAAADSKDRDDLEQQLGQQMARLAMRPHPTIAADETADLQLRISGVARSDWRITIQGGRCRAGAGTTDTPDCTLKLTAADAVAMFDGALDPVAAFTAGRLHVDGDMAKALLLVEMLPADPETRAPSDIPGSPKHRTDGNP